MADNQLDLFGTEESMQQIENNYNKPKNPGRPKRLTMQERHGELKGHKCKECDHFIIKRYANTYFKCELWSESSSSASDIRANATACNKFLIRR